MRYVESLNQALLELLAEDERVYVLGEDILDPYGGAFKVTKGLSSAFPKRVLTTPVSEAGITGLAIGMALRGLRPILEIMFGDFLLLCADQIVNSATKFGWMYNDQVHVPLVIRTPMGGRRGYGPTHSQTLESFFLGVPGLTIVAPSNYHDPGSLLKVLVQQENGPCLFVESKLLYAQKLLMTGQEAKVGDFFVQTVGADDRTLATIDMQLVSGERPDVVLIAYGGMAPFAVEAAHRVFLEEEILVRVLIPSLLKPFPLRDVLPAVQECGRVVIIEEGVRTSGWGAELGSLLVEDAFDYLKKPISRLGAKEVPIPGSKPVEELVLPQVGDIERAIHSQIGRK